ncbi:MAG: hypothetical protein JNM66_12020 [Bryobacterales bacterium]|nr:hypothetical protein [Bryobacterales bacterium]
MDILHYLDVAIGFTLAMMVLATLIGTTTAAWLALIQSKVRQLQNGLQQVLSVLGDTVSAAERLDIAHTLLRDDMMNSWSPIRRLGLGATEAVGREEFVMLLLRRAGAWKSLDSAIQSITGQPPAVTLRAVEKAILDQESARPDAPANVWRTRALAQEAPDLAARLFAQFDDVMTRTDDNTAFSAKFVSAILTLAFLVVYPINSFDILARLMNDAAITQSLIAKAQDPNLLNEVLAQGLFGDVFSRPFQLTPPTNPGVWTTFVLVSLGAPFWQGVLDKLLGLRSKITTKTDQERTHRATQT